MTRLAFLLALAFGLMLGGLTLFASTPARAIEISGVTFLQCTSRACTVPFTQEISFQASGAPPMVGNFAWGDGVSTQYIQNNGTSVTFDVSHRYTVKGNYTLNVTVTDEAGAIWTSYYKVSAWTAGYTGAAAVSARIEGYGIIPALQRSSSEKGPIMGIVTNTGSAYIQPWEIEFFDGTWGHRCWTQTVTEGLVPGAMAYVAASGDAIFGCGQVSPGTVNYWVRVTSSSWPSLNGTSPVMPISFADSEPTADFVINAVTPTISVGIGSYVKEQYQIVNTGQFTLDFYGSFTESPSNSLLLMPADLGNPTHSLLMNGTAQQRLVGSTQLFQGVGRLILQPGQSVYVNRTIQAISAVQSGSVVLTDTIQPKCIDQSGDSVNACDLLILGLRPHSVTVNVQVTEVGATIQMVSAVPIANGTEQFTGVVITMGSNTPYLSVLFRFWKTSTPATTYDLAAGTIFSPGTVQAVASGLSASTNYTVEFVAQGVGPEITSNAVNFVTAGGCTGTGCAGTAPSSQIWVTSFLYFLSSASGVPAEIFGLFFGMMLIGAFLLFLIVIPSVVGADVDLPEFVWMGVLLLLVIVNVLLFLWPSWVIILIVVPEAIMLAGKFMSPSSGGSNG